MLPGMTVVCGDSHTSTHGAAGALAHGIGTSEVEHVMATQCLIQRKMKNFRVEVTGRLPEGATAKDIALAVIGEIGTAGGTGYALEFTGSAIRELTMEGRMTLCNMAIEAGAAVAWWRSMRSRWIISGTNRWHRKAHSGKRQRPGGGRFTVMTVLYLIGALRSMATRLHLT